MLKNSKDFLLESSNDAQAFHVYPKNHEIRRGPYTVRKYLTRAFKKSNCTQDRPRNVRLSVVFFLRQSIKNQKIAFSHSCSIHSEVSEF